MVINDTLHHCLRAPIPEIFQAANYLDEAVNAHLNGQTEKATELLKLADILSIREWTESIWGKNSIYVIYREVIDAPPILPNKERTHNRMPNAKLKKILIERDGYHCRFCGIPVISREVVKFLHIHYPEALPWGKKNEEQHAAFQAMDLQYDHLLPHSRGGQTSFENLVITCAPCNYGRSEKLIEEVGLSNPFDREPIQSSWDGLERIFKGTSSND